MPISAVGGSGDGNADVNNAPQKTSEARTQSGGGATSRPGPNADAGTGVTGRDTFDRSSAPQPERDVAGHQAAPAEQTQRETIGHVAARLEQIVRESAQHGPAPSAPSHTQAAAPTANAGEAGRTIEGGANRAVTGAVPSQAASGGMSSRGVNGAVPERSVGGGANHNENGVKQNPNAGAGTPAAAMRHQIALPTSLHQYGAQLANNSPMDAQGNPRRVDPNRPIAIDFDPLSRTYNPRAAAFVAQQNALSGGLSLGEARRAGSKSMGYSSSVDPGTDGGTWRLANGPAKGVLYGASMIGAASALGYHTARDQADVTAWPNVETGETGKIDGKRHFTQRPGTGVAQGGQGPVQITAPYHDRRGANNPAYSAVQAITAGERTQGGHTARVKDAIIPYNSGVKNDKVGQSEGARGSYAGYMQRVVDQLKWTSPR